MLKKCLMVIVLLRCLIIKKKALKEFDAINEDIYYTTFYSQFISGIMFPMQFFIGNVAFILIAGVGAVLVVNGAIQVGLIQTFLTYTRQINQPIQSLGSIASVLQSTAAAAERIFDLLDAENEPEDDVDANISKTLKVMLFLIMCILVMLKELKLLKDLVQISNLVRWSRL